MPNTYRSYATQEEAQQVATEATAAFEKLVAQAREPGGPLHGVTDRELAWVPRRFYVDQPLRGPHRARFAVHALLGFRPGGADISEPKEGWATRWPLPLYTDLVLQGAARAKENEQRMQDGLRAKKLHEQAFGPEPATTDRTRIRATVEKRSDKLHVTLTMPPMTEAQLLELGEWARRWETLNASKSEGLSHIHPLLLRKRSG